MFFYSLPNIGTRPVRFVTKICAVSKYLCVGSSDVVSNLALRQFGFYVKHLRNLPDHQIFANPIGTKKIHNAVWSRGYTKYQPEVIFMNLLRAQNMFLWRTTGKASEHQGVSCSSINSVNRMISISQHLCCIGLYVSKLYDCMIQFVPLICFGNSLSALATIMHIQVGTKRWQPRPLFLIITTFMKLTMYMAVSD